MGNEEKKVVKVKTVKVKPKEAPAPEPVKVEVPKEPVKQEPVAEKAAVPLYKKWWFWLIAAAFALGVIALLTRGGTGSDNTSDSGNNTASATAVATASVTEAVNAFNGEAVLQQLQVTPYTYKMGYGDSQVYILQIKNNSEYTLDISASITFLDASNNMLGTAESTEYDVPAGKEFVMRFINESSFDHVDQKLSVKETQHYDPVSNDLVIDSQSIVGDKVVFTVRNAGDTDIEFPLVSALFFKNDELVFTEYTYVEPEGASNLAAGQSVNKEINCYGKEFDKVLLFTTGRSEMSF